jgi:hypothetical protein
VTYTRVVNPVGVCRSSNWQQLCRTTLVLRSWRDARAPWLLEEYRS